MRKKQLILPLILFLFSILFAGAPDTLWTRTYGGDFDDVGYSVQQASDGGFYVLGKTGQPGTGESNVYLIRTDSVGDTLWTKTYGGNPTNEGRSVQIMSDGGLIITGFTGSTGGADYMDVYLIRTDANGDTLWTKTYGGTDWDYGNSIQITKDGGFIIAAETQSFRARDSRWVGNLYLIRTDSIGDTLWTKVYHKDALNTVDNEVQQTSDGGFIIIGCIDLSGTYNDDYYVLRTDVNGDSLWAKTYGGTRADIGYSVQETNDRGYTFAGAAYSFGAGDMDVYLIHTNEDGDTLSTRTYGGYGHDGCKSMEKTNDGGLIITGKSNSFGNDGDVYILRTDFKGDTLWTKTCDGPYERDNDCGHSVQQTSDGGFIIAGELEALLEEGITDVITDVYLIRLDKETTGIQNENPNFPFKPDDFIVLYNHGNITISYTLPYSTSVKLEAYDIKGKLVKVIQDQFLNKGSYSVQWDNKRFGSGVYYIKLSTGSNTLTRKAIIIK